jgi:hypothetical protein
MFICGSKTAKSNISQKLVKKPKAQTTSKFRPRTNKSGSFLLNMVMMGIKKSSFNVDSKKSQFTLMTKCTLKKVTGQNVLRN